MAGAYTALHEFAPTGDTTPPSPAPGASLSISGSTVTATQTTAPESGATRKLERRAQGGTAAWTVVATDATPAIGRTLVDSAVPAGTYEYEVADYDSSSNRTYTGQRWCQVVISSSQWDTVVAAVRNQLVLQGVTDSDIYDGQKPEENYGSGSYVLTPLHARSSVQARANGGLVLRDYPVQVEYRTQAIEVDDDEKTEAVRDGVDLLIDAFDGKSPSDLATLTGLELSSVEETGLVATSRLEDEITDELRVRVVLHFPIWEVR